jgi:hypothetical protein
MSHLGSPSAHPATRQPAASEPATSENPLRRAFWLGDVDARIPALLRAALGLLVASDLLDRLRDFHAFYTADGLVPAAHEALRFGLRWSAFDLTSNRAATLALFLCGLPLALAFALGFGTRVTSVLLWAFVLSLHNRNLNVCDGGDAVLGALLFWSMFTDGGAALSLDVQLGRRRAQATVPAVGLRFLQLQVALIYLVTFLAKSGPTWHDGTAVTRAIASSDWQRGLAPLLARHPGLGGVLTRATLVIEGAFPLLVLSPWRPTLTRAIAVVAGLALHLGIFLTMRIGIFCEVMPLAYLVFVPSALLDWLQARLDRRPAAARRQTPAAVDAPARPRARLVLVAVLALPFSLIVADQLARARGGREPPALIAALTLIGQRQNWRMFAPDAPLFDVTWRAPGTLADGRAVELTDTVLPALRSHRGFLYSRWHRLRNSLIGGAPDLLLPFGRYVCHRANDQLAGAALLRFELVATLRPTLEPGPAREQVILRQACVMPTPAQRP